MGGNIVTLQNIEAALGKYIEQFVPVMSRYSEVNLGDGRGALPQSLSE
jgi:hypothetical protein